MKMSFFLTTQSSLAPPGPSKHSTAQPNDRQVTPSNTDPGQVPKAQFHELYSQTVKAPKRPYSSEN